MNQWSVTVGTALCLNLWLMVAVSHGSERVNPFAPPAASQAERAPMVRAGGVSRPVQHPRLRAVLHSTNGSMANLSGHILGEQESALGYRLVAVQEHSADFVHRGQRVRLYVARDQETASQ